MKLTQWIEDVPNGGHPRGSYEAQMAVRRVFAKLNPGKDYDETMARLRAERGEPAPKPKEKMGTCTTCGVLFIRSPYGPPAEHCGPCTATVMRMQRLNGITAMANKARKYPR